MIKKWNSLLSEHISLIGKYIESCRDIHEEYSSNQTKKVDPGFNIFTITSNYYYKENFHSEIIKSLLDPNEKHNEKNKFLNIFIDLINQCNIQRKINKSDFNNSIVQLEKHKIDISIIDNTSKKAIIIENKINNAVDQNRQLPRYFDKLKDSYEVVAIVYLPLNSSKKPNKDGWSENDTKAIEPILKLIPAHSLNESEPNLFCNWIKPSILATTNLDCHFLLRQYGTLLQFLNTNSMDTITLSKFYNSLLIVKNFETSVSIKNMMEELPEYLAIRIEDKYKNNCHPFKEVSRDGSIINFNGFEFAEIDFGIQIEFGTDPESKKYLVNFWAKNDDEYNMIEEFRDEFELLNSFELYEDSVNDICKYFNFHEENELFAFLDEFRIILKDLE